MSNIPASSIKDLRERTGLGMMECKKALEETGGDIELAIENLRKSSSLKAAKKASRVAGEGVIVDCQGKNHRSLIEINCETDFVARDDSFKAFVESVREAGTTLSDLSALQSAVEPAREALVQRIGENIQVRRVMTLQAPAGGALYGYVHTNNRIGAIVSLDAPHDSLGSDLAMQVCAMAPEVLSAEDIPKERLLKEKEIFLAQNEDAGKSPDILEKMVEGRLKKFATEVSLLGQAFVKENKKTVAEICKVAGVKPTAFVRVEVGEGIEKEATDFAAEVMAQAGLNQ